MLKTIKVRFQTENNRLPRDMSKVLVSFLKGSIKAVSPEKYDEWWGSGNHIKSFCWSAYYPGADTHDGIMDLQQNWFQINISTPCDEDFHLLDKALRNRWEEKISINKNSIKVVSVRIYNEKPVDGGSIVVKSESPVIVRGKEKLFLTDKDDMFASALTISANSLLTHFGLSGKLEIIPLQTRSVSVLAFGPATGNVGCFKISGSKEALNFILSSGIGGRRSEGFGRLKLIERTSK